ncbi:hypothetical protein [uncultured Elizabethkingia sp.]|uniref:hypothetical protein n=1 Tax=uncultured Elizabethkingia sp. TaxID=432638 RepID=UPI0025985E9E|nr:hypothetical protein [uncultured Elizabethkingia sp.]
MRKKILFAPLWGIFALSLLSSCRTEDGAITQKQIEDKRFTVLIPKSGKSVNYADGFAFLMKRYDNVNGTNISGVNNTTKANLNASVTPLFQNTGSYVEFKVRSYIMKEENGEKWMIFPRVENNQVIGLIMCTLKEKETFIAFDEIKSDSDYYKQLLPLFQEAFNRYNRRKGSLALNASIKPMAIGGGGETENPVEGCGDDVQQCGSIEEVVVPGKPNKPKDPPSKPVGASSCDSLSQCPPPTDEGGGGGGGGTPNPSSSLPIIIKKIDTENLDKCSKQILEKIITAKNFSSIINQFNGDKASFNWTIETSNSNDFGNGKLAITDWQNNQPNNYITSLGQDYVNSASRLSIARTIIHEAIHAYILSYLDSDVSMMEKDFSELLKAMIDKKYGDVNSNLEQYHHEEMAMRYINTVSETLAIWDNYSQNNQYYIDLAWGGLLYTDTFKNSRLLTDTDKKRISDRNYYEDKYTPESVSNKCN